MYVDVSGRVVRLSAVGADCNSSFHELSPSLVFLLLVLLAVSFLSINAPRTIIDKMPLLS